MSQALFYVCTLIIYSHIFISWDLDGWEFDGTVAMGYNRGTDLSKGLQEGKLGSSLRGGEQAGMEKAPERRLPGAHLPISPLPTDGVSPLEQPQ